MGNGYINPSHSTAPDFTYRMGQAISSLGPTLQNAFGVYNELSDREKQNEAMKEFWDSLNKEIGDTGDTKPSYSTTMEGAAPKVQDTAPKPIVNSAFNFGNTAGMDASGITPMAKAMQHTVSYDPTAGAAPTPEVAPAPESYASMTNKIRGGSAFYDDKGAAMLPQGTQPASALAPTDKKSVIDQIDFKDPMAQQKALQDGFGGMSKTLGGEKSKRIFMNYMKLAAKMGQAGKPELAMQMGLKAMDMLENKGVDTYIFKKLFEHGLRQDDMEKAFKYKLQLAQSLGAKPQEIDQEARFLTSQFTATGQSVNPFEINQMAVENIIDRKTRMASATQQTVPGAAPNQASPQAQGVPGAGGRRIPGKPQVGQRERSLDMRDESLFVAELDKLRGIKDPQLKDVVTKNQNLTNARNMLLEVIRNPKLLADKNFSTKLSMAITAAMTGSRAPAMRLVMNSIPNTRGTLQANLEQWFKDAPQQFLSQAFINHFMEQLDAEDKSFNQIISDRLLALKSGVNPAYLRDPEKKKRIEETILSMTDGGGSIEAGTAPGGKVKVSNGKDTFMIPASDIENAQKDGYKVID